MKEQYTINDLVRVAKRENNTKRPYLYVNPLQGKHLPVSPTRALVLFAQLAEKAERIFRGERLLVIGFAETATAIGASLACLAENVDFYMSTTREHVPGFSYLFFSESHSHATEQRLVREQLDEYLPQVDRVVFAEDEVTTGNTILHLIAALREEFPDIPLRFGVLSLLNSMSTAQLRAMAEEWIAVDFLLRVPEEYGADEIKFYEYTPPEDNLTLACDPPIRMLELSDGWNARILTPAVPMREQCESFAKRAFLRLPALSPGTSVLVLGTEECMFPGLLLGRELEVQYPQVTVRFHATTRSPIEVTPDEDYPLHVRNQLESVYAAGRRTYLYNLKRYDHVILVTDAISCNPQGLNSIYGALERYGNDRLTVIQWRCHEEQL